MDLPQEYADAMVQHALEDDPNECCGILSGRDGAVTKHYRIANTEASPYRYNMDPKELLHALQDTESLGWEFIAFYHSHTHSEAYPSATDVRLAENWPDPFYILVSLADKQNPVVRAFRIADGQVAEEPLTVT
jgi:proteasome lid subunit RPN8/RPN11